jgi:RNA polymerase sigma factor (sigma-70 family)
MKDLELARACVKGSTRAWEELVDQYSRLVYSLFYSLLRQRNASSVPADEVDELFHEFFLFLRQDNYKKLKTFQGKNNATPTWLRQVAIHFTIDYLRRSHPLVSLDAVDGDDDLPLLDTLASSHPSPQELAQRNELLEHLTQCIARLKDEEKLFVELHINRRVPLEALTQILEAARSTVDMRKARIIGRLRECFKSKGFMLDL